MQDGRIPKHLLYCEFATGSRPAGRPVLCYKVVCKQDLKDVNPAVCRWRQAVKAGIKVFEKKREYEWEADIAPTDPDPGTYYTCSRAWCSKIGLYSHRRCMQTH